MHGSCENWEEGRMLKDAFGPRLSSPPSPPQRGCPTKSTLPLSLSPNRDCFIPSRRVCTVRVLFRVYTVQHKVRLEGVY